MRSQRADSVSGPTWVLRISAVITVRKKRGRGDGRNSEWYLRSYLLLQSDCLLYSSKNYALRLLSSKPTLISKKKSMKLFANLSQIPSIQKYFQYTEYLYLIRFLKNEHYVI